MITVKRLSASGSSVDNLKANYDQAQVAETSFKATDLRVSDYIILLLNNNLRSVKKYTQSDVY